jgi:outer membrane protein TolC
MRFYSPDTTKLSPVVGVTAFGAVLLILLSMGGCAVTPKPFAMDELARINQADREAARAGIPPIAGPLSLEEAIARALKYNLDHRVKVFEQSLSIGQMEAGRYDMLPRLLAEAGYAWRDKENTRLSLNPVTETLSDIGYISSAKTHTTYDIGLHWNILDFGVGYYNAKENADRVLIALERRRRAMHSLIQNVRTAFWRAAAADKLGAQVRATIQEAEAALDNSRKVSDERVKSPNEALRYQRTLLENLRLLESVERELASARIELASLIGADPGSHIKLAEPLDAKPMQLDLAVDKMEEIALTHNADLREQHYNARIAAIETRRALVKLLPGLSFDYVYRHDDDKYLVNQRWQDAGLQVSYNLFNLLSGPSRMKAAEMGKQVAETKRMALQMTVLTQVHIARYQYDDALHQYERADSIYDVDNRLAKLSLSQEKSQMASNLERISASTTSILSSVRLYHAMAKVQEAASRLQATLGLEPEIGSLDDADLPTLEKQIEQSLKRWTQLEQPAPATLAATPKAEPVASPPNNAQSPAIPAATQSEAAWWRPRDKSALTLKTTPTRPAVPVVLAADR